VTHKIGDEPRGGTARKKQAKEPRWHTWEFFGREYKVRLAREFEEHESTWREYENERGQKIKVQVRGSGGRRAEAEESSAYRAAQRFAGYL
jgi:hypothetical protein